jgi:nitrite reductase/ring-hydroxylating ferredoxin subunit
MAEYLRNAWYMFGWEQDIGQELVSKTILGRQVLVMRSSDGSLSAMDDRCPHRFAPLSMGRRQGDTIACRYHGLVFDSSGQCVHNPFSDLIPPGCKVTTYPLEVKHRGVWLWMGDAEAADPGFIPDFSFLDEPGHLLSTFHIGADYRLIIDNLMDLSHIEFLHTDSFGGGGSILHGELSVREEHPYIYALWEMDNIAPPPWATAMVEPGAKVDHWLDMRWSAPGSLLIEIGLTGAGAPREPGIIPPLLGAHILTPETDTSSHYFYSTAPAAQSPVDPDAPKGVSALEDEDKPMLEAIQRAMGDAEFWSLRPAILSVDTGSVRVRRRLAKMISDEQKATFETA